MVDRGCSESRYYVEAQAPVGRVIFHGTAANNTFRRTAMPDVSCSLWNAAQMMMPQSLGRHVFNFGPCLRNVVYMLCIFLSHTWRESSP